MNPCHDFDHRDEGSPDTKGAVGRYLIIGELGRGGGGVVLRAYDPKLQREVALKLLRLGQLSAESGEQVISEARAMAKLSHPNVVAVYDVESTASSGVALAMEFVEGSSLSEWIRQEHGWREVVDVFIAAGTGLVAAHQAGLLHRDFKPANVLLGSRDGRVRVTDFGLAVVHQNEPSSDESGPVITLDAESEVERCIVGTPAYMSPEQHVGAELDHSSDQYSFCVSLWFGLVGKRPFGTRSKAVQYAQLRGPPAWPTDVRVPKHIVQAIRRGLAPKAADRWPSMEALLKRLEPTYGRQRVVVMSAGGVALVAAGLVSAVVAARDKPVVAPVCQGAPDLVEPVWGEQRRIAARRAFVATGLGYATQAWASARRSVDDYAQRWISVHGEACEATAVHGEQSAHVLDLRMACLDRAKTELGAVANLLERADSAVVEKSYALVQALPDLALCSDLDALASAVAPPAPEQVGAVASLRAALAQARTLHQVGKHHDALAVLSGWDGNDVLGRYPPGRVEFLSAYAHSKASVGRAEEAVATARVALRESLALDYPEQALFAANELSYELSDSLGRAKEARAYVDIALGLAKRIGDRRDLAATLSRSAIVLQRLGKIDEAIAAQEECIAILVASNDALTLAFAKNNLAIIYHSAGRLDDMEVELKAALTIQDQRLGPEHPESARTRGNLAAVFFMRDKFAEAEALQRQTLAVERKVLGAGHPKTQESLANLALMLIAQSDFEQGNVVSAELLVLRKADSRTKRPLLAAAFALNGLTLVGLKRFAEGEQAHARGLALRIEEYGMEHLEVAKSRDSLAFALAGQGKFELALEQRRLNVTLLETLAGAQDAKTLAAKKALAAVLSELGRD